MEYILHGKKVGLFKSNVVFLKKAKSKKVMMDGKRITMIFPRGRYGIVGIASNDEKIAIDLTLNPSIGCGSYGHEFDLKVKPNEVTVCPSSMSQ